MVGDSYSSHKIHKHHFIHFLSLLERCKLHAEVDELLDQISGSEDAAPNAVLLGNLINEAGMLCNWRRADCIWDMLVIKLAVEPTHISYVAYAKAHLLAARPTVAVQILHSMRKAGLGSGNGQASVLHLQSLLLICHSSPTESHLSDLATFLKGSAGLNVTGSGRLLESQWRQLRNSASQLISNPLSLTLHQLLVHHHAKRRSLMTNWPDYAAGSEYLSSQSSKVKLSEKMRPSGLETFVGALGLGFSGLQVPLGAIGSSKFATKHRSQAGQLNALVWFNESDRSRSCSRSLIPYSKP